MRIVLIIMFLSFAINCGAESITTSTVVLSVENNDTVGGRHEYYSFHEGIIENLENVIFSHWNFSREEPHTKVFKNCKNLKFVKCNLVNVKLQKDFIVEDSLIMHKKKYEENGIKYEEIETIYGKTHKYRIDKNEKEEIETLISVKDTSNDKKITVNIIDN